MGYRTIAIEEVCDYDLLNQKSNNSRGRKSDEGLFPEPSDIKWLKKEFEDKLRILQRLTIIYRDAKIANSMVSINRNFLKEKFQPNFIIFFSYIL